MVATSCDLKAPRCTTIAPPVRFHGPRGGVFVGHRPPRDPGDPRLNNIYIYIRWKSETKFYVCSDVPHTHNFSTRNIVTHHLSHTILLHTTLHIQLFLTHRSSTTCLVYPAFPVLLQLCVLIIGRNWFVGLSGPLICWFFLVQELQTSRVATPQGDFHVWKDNT